MTRILYLLLIIAVPAQAAEPKIPIIHSTDLCHPYDDPDDHYDLDACLPCGSSTSAASCSIWASTRRPGRAVRRSSRCSVSRDGRCLMSWA